ncbi:DNA methyltransferase [Sphingomonas sp. Leaf357]|uniref:type ISP restriction/modification enzyme n=1 Tax=Sphingomonas sp. Leaf357 TaxID=1736350 RepID=UPI0006FDE872|nr:type ISP restriction/modification enzyme [Sphingomonas sp. Leaf357]KQS02294.1 DNA methyltransferase [Sphingomonas sp. Leaf357]
MNIQSYLDEVRAKYASGQATEHSYRPALETLFRSIDPELEIINEPRRVAVGAPDFVFNRKGISIGWAEAKDVGRDITRFRTGDYGREQKDRYRKGLPNLIYTNGIDFEFLREGDRINFVSIADLLPSLPARPDRFDELSRNLRSFAQATPISIRSAAKLAQMMAGKAAIIKDVLGQLLHDDTALRSALGGQYRAFKAELLPHMDIDEFADLYAETITYGMFAARLHDDSLETFSRSEALQHLPRSNPFLRSLFGYIAGPDLDDRIAWIIDDLADILRASDPRMLFRDFGKFTARNDPFVHFYEDFLKEYNPKKRKSRGVWYTPEPVVDFIVRAVDDVLKTEFGLPDGLADTSKVTVDYDTGTNDAKGRPRLIRKDVHRVQILDPATGTGTFLAKAVQTIADRVKSRAPGKWSGYVERELIPRIHGFELLMASYAMCHMKLDMQLRETGYRPSASPPRLSVWLTNALEPGEREVRDLFFTALVDEARGASEVKRNTPIMCIIGNPPYSGESANTGAWITGLMDAYKREPGGKQRLNERQTRWLLDDYVKFLRLAEATIARSEGGGVLGFITNHGYLDNPTFRGMRWHLLRSFDAIHVLDLHGNAKKKETGPGGATDKNVFDIQQGVAIIIAIRRAGKKRDGLGTIHHGDVWGSRDDKYDALWGGTPESLSDTILAATEPAHAFVPRDASKLAAYELGFSLGKLFKTASAGILTARDALSIDHDRSDLWQRINHIAVTDVDTLRRHYAVGKDSRSWSLAGAKADVVANLDSRRLCRVVHRPLDMRWTFYTGTTKGLHFFPADKVSDSLFAADTIALLTPKQTKEQSGAFVIDTIATHKSYSAYDITSVMPLYITARTPQGGQGKLSGHGRALNLDAKIYAAICKAAGLKPSPDAGTGTGNAFRTATGAARPAEVKVFDYIYAVLHAPAYRETYAEFLKIDFPRIPYPRDAKTFAVISDQGEALRRLHLMEPDAIGDTPYAYRGDGDDVVAPGFPKFEKGRVRINPDQFFDAVPAIAWSAHIGGYQPAQKWLKDRRGRSLSWDDIGHYQRIVKILAETDRIMAGIVVPLE